MITWIIRAIRVMGVLATDLPKALEDGKITIGEVSTIFVKILEIFGLPTFVEVPPDIADRAMAMTTKMPDEGAPRA